MKIKMGILVYERKIVNGTHVVSENTLPSDAFS